MNVTSVSMVHLLDIVYLTVSMPRLCDACIMMCCDRRMTIWSTWQSWSVSSDQFRHPWSVKPSTICFCWHCNIVIISTLMVYLCSCWTSSKGKR